MVGKSFTYKLELVPSPYPSVRLMVRQVEVTVDE